MACLQFGAWCRLPIFEYPAYQGNPKVDSFPLLAVYHKLRRNSSLENSFRSQRVAVIELKYVRVAAAIAA